MGGDRRKAKKRLDKYYYLAKEQGYRARSAFKLIQLNQKFNFLEKSRVIVDLCAAPGGWLQVARKFAPISSIIIGVDRVPIKPIHNCLTLQEDITEESCRQALKRELKHWKADCVLHDGSPNVGQTWIQDAFDQADLTLKALKLSTDILKQGGYFITKVFRSRDYFALMWVLNKLFYKVHATKPAASRNVSAEIFVVCCGFKAPTSLDPRFLDSKFIFKEVEGVCKSQALFTNNRRNSSAVGYKDDEDSFHETLSVSDFLGCTDPLLALSRCAEVIFQPEIDDPYVGHMATTQEIRECLKDIKVLNKKDLRNVLRWRKALLPLFEEINKKEQNVLEDQPSEHDNVEITAEESELLEANEKLKELQLLKTKKEKAKKRKENRHLLKRKNKELHGMGLPANRLTVEDELFSMKLLCEKPIMRAFLKNKVPLLKEEKQKVQKNEVDDEAKLQAELSENSDPELHHYKMQRIKEMDEYYNIIKNKRSKESKVAEKLVKINSHNKALLEYNKPDKSSTIQNFCEGKKHVSSYSNKSSLAAESSTDDSRSIDMWFAQNEFSEILSDLENEEQAKKELERRLARKSTVTPAETSDLPKRFQQKLHEKSASLKTRLADGELETVKFISECDLESETDDFSDSKNKNSVKLDAQGLALGSLLISKKRKARLEDNSYHRFAFQDGPLPDWFLDDQQKHYKKYIHVPSDVLQFYSKRLKEINSRPIKKVQEAKARKKLKASRKLEGMKRKAESIIDNPNMSDAFKRRTIEKLHYSRKTRSKPRNVQYVVASKSGARRKSQRSHSVKGPYKLVDPRMKKDKEGLKRALERKKLRIKKRKSKK